MSGTTESLRRKIAVANELGSVVRSMKAVAASSITQYENAVRSLDDYSRTVELGLSVCLRHTAPIAPPVAAHSEVRARGVVLVGSDQGLVGRFNELLLDFATQTLAKLPPVGRKIWSVGERMHALIVDGGADTGTGPGSRLSAPTSVQAIGSLVGQILIATETARERGEIDEVYLFHNQPQGGAAYHPVSKRLLPLDRLWRQRLTAHAWPTQLPPQVVEDGRPALRAFIREYLFVLLFQACAESLASENASRLASMQRAENNIRDLLKTLNRRFHALRHEAIDEELFDVISAFEALSGHRTPRGRQ